MAGKKAHFSGWLKDFKRLKLAVTGDTDDTAGEGNSVVDII
jgi:hypothetical protein